MEGNKEEESDTVGPIGDSMNLVAHCQTSLTDLLKPHFAISLYLFT